MVRKTIKCGAELALSFAILCIIRIIFESELDEALVYVPIVFLGLHCFFELLQQRRENQYITKLENQDQISGRDFMEAMNLMIKLIDRFNDNDQSLLQRLYYYHRISCFNDECICTIYN